MSQNQASNGRSSLLWESAYSQPVETFGPLLPTAHTPCDSWRLCLRSLLSSDRPLDLTSCLSQTLCSSCFTTELYSSNPASPWLCLQPLDTLSILTSRNSMKSERETSRSSANRIFFSSTSPWDPQFYMSFIFKVTVSHLSDRHFLGWESPRAGWPFGMYCERLGGTLSCQPADLQGEPFCSHLKEALNWEKATATWLCSVSMMPGIPASPLGYFLSQS